MPDKKCYKPKHKIKFTYKHEHYIAHPTKEQGCQKRFVSIGTLKDIMPYKCYQDNRLENIVGVELCQNRHNVAHTCDKE